MDKLKTYYGRNLKRSCWPEMLFLPEAARIRNNKGQTAGSISLGLAKSATAHVIPGGGSVDAHVI